MLYASIKFLAVDCPAILPDVFFGDLPLRANALPSRTSVTWRLRVGCLRRATVLRSSWPDNPPPSVSSRPAGVRVANLIAPEVPRSCVPMLSRRWVMHNSHALLSSRVRCAYSREFTGGSEWSRVHGDGGCGTANGTKLVNLPVIPQEGGIPSRFRRLRRIVPGCRKRTRLRPSVRGPLKPARGHVRLNGDRVYRQGYGRHPGDSAFHQLGLPEISHVDHGLQICSSWASPCANCWRSTR